MLIRDIFPGFHSVPAGLRSTLALFASYAVPFVHRILHGLRKWPSESAPATVEPACAWHIIETQPLSAARKSHPPPSCVPVQFGSYYQNPAVPRGESKDISLGRHASAVKPGIFMAF